MKLPQKPTNGQVYYSSIAIGLAVVICRFLDSLDFLPIP